MFKVFLNNLLILYVKEIVFQILIIDNCYE